MSGAILERLRAATQGAHTALETRLAFLTGDLTVGDYKALLSAMYGFYLPWEDAVRPWRERLFGEESRAREKTSSLAADLQFHEIKRAGLPLCKHTPCIDHLGAALGNMYVMEGATLGGQLITRNVEKQLGLTDGQGYRFFRSYGPQTGSMWRSFQRHLGASDTTRDCEAEVVRSAIAAFVHMERWLSEAGF